MVNPFHLHNWGNSLDICEFPFSLKLRAQRLLSANAIVIRTL